MIWQHAEVSAQQLERSGTLDGDGPSREAAADPAIGKNSGTESGGSGGIVVSTPKLKTRFYARVLPNITKLGSSVGTIANEIVVHLQLLKDAEVEVTLEIRAKAPHGIDEKTIRTITENARALKFEVTELE